MKATIRKASGDVIELDGTPEEIAKVATPDPGGVGGAGPCVRGAACRVCMPSPNAPPYDTVGTWRIARYPARPQNDSISHTPTNNAGNASN